ncbi:MAG TPA: helix-turn-helix transcriptional regulator [Candidatus Nanopelagicales bacterium]|nr:helix-turn-helix transcriptional regulator [Candidatus Nanopelagicales bacterium]
MTGTTSPLSEARSRLGLTQAQAAELLATSQANISAYERGRLQPGRLVSERIEALGALQPDSIYSTYLASTIPGAAAQIRTDLATNRSETDMLRVVIQASDDFHKLTQQTDRAFFLSEPSPTGSREWDALIAGLAVHLCREAQMDRAPMWTTDPSRSIDFVWWIDSAAPAARAQLLQQAIPAMRARGVMMSRRNLESV